ncbi:hypothetical protein ASPCAL10739 [Aspergillus calidoustus]|uniref:Uncharacterized protein n=1 Tax=Aspergillus calidoustus TaxID=454130 RepID=A0A0U5GAE8_ASPCI|nr:hypothetical protein ASPCAL10739 [Aspergillus calidoustus]
MIFQQFFPEFYENEGLKSFFFMTCSMFLVVFVWFPYPGDQEGPLEEMDPWRQSATSVNSEQSKNSAADKEIRDRRPISSLVIPGYSDTFANVTQGRVGEISNHARGLSLLMDLKFGH